MKLDKDALVKLIKEVHLQELSREDLEDLGGKPNNFHVYGFFDNGTGNLYSSEPNIKLALDSACKYRNEEIRDVEERLDVSAYRIIIQCPKDDDDFPLGKTSFTVFGGKKKNNAWRHFEIVKGSCGKDKWVANTIPPGYYSACGEPAIAESKDYKRLAKKWLTEKRKISAEKNSRVLVSEVKSVLRKESSDLKRFIQKAINQQILNWTSRSKPSSFRAGSGMATELPASLQYLGLKEVSITFTATSKIRDIDVGGSYDRFGREMSSDPNTSRLVRHRGFTYDLRPGAGPTININVSYNNKLGPAELRALGTKLSDKLNDVVHHELRHFWQATPGYRGKPMGAWARSRIYDHNFQPFLYLTSEHEVDSWVRGLANRAKRSKGRRTFEQLVDEVLKRYSGLRPVDAQGVRKPSLTGKQAKHIKKLWMDHAMRQIPCSLNNKGLPINPKGCRFSAKRKKERKLKHMQNELRRNPQKRAQLKKEIDMLRNAIEQGVEVAPQGKVTKFLKKLPFIGRLLVAGGIYWAIDSAYEREGWEGVGKELISAGFDMTPYVGDIKGLFEALGELLTRKGRTALKADPAFFSPARGKL